MSGGRYNGSKGELGRYNAREGCERYNASIERKVRGIITRVDEWSRGRSWVGDIAMQVKKQIRYYNASNERRVGRVVMQDYNASIEKKVRGIITQVDEWSRGRSWVGDITMQENERTGAL